jgi:hypothetical protein
VAASTSNSDPDGVGRRRRAAVPGMVRAIILAAGVALPVWLAAGLAAWTLLR